MIPNRTPLSVGELSVCLSRFSPDRSVVALYDCGCAGGSVVRVEIGPGPDDDRESVILIVE